VARAPKPHIPQHPGEFTAEWFTTALADRAHGATVTDANVYEIGIGIGFVGDVFRCELTWDRDDPALPASVVVKVPAAVLANRALGEGLMAYEREILIYRQFGGRMGLPMPEHLDSEMDPNPAPWMIGALEMVMDRLPLRGVNWLIGRLLNLPESAMRRFVVMIEDIHDARPAAQFDGGTLDDAYQALDVLAAFHAANWMNQELIDAEPLVWSIGRTPKVYQASYMRNRDAFLEQFGRLLGPETVARIDAIQERIPTLTEELTRPPWTILHGDYRLDNVLFRDNGDIVVLDYQLVLWGRAGWDVAYFITTALAPEHRAQEAALLTAYHDALVRHGIDDYSYGALLRDVHVTKDLLGHRMVGTGDIINTEVAGRDQTFIDLMVTRVTGWMSHNATS